MRSLALLLLDPTIENSLGSARLAYRSGRPKTMNRITVTATRWDGGWELEIDPANITQVRNLAKAASQVRDYLDTLHPEVDHANWKIQLIKGM